jgi:sulfate/thiosulfate transport system substrate-binding protein
MHRIRELLGILLVTGAVAGAATAATSSTNLTLVAYSTPREAYAQVIPAFQSTSTGKDVSFTQSYGASGDQSRAVLNGLSGDVVAFSLAPDVQRLVKPGLVASNWNKDKYHGMVTDSVVVLSFRPGNPKHIRGWSDLTKPGVDVITPNPFISGGARWNVMAAYGAQLKAGKTHTQAVKYLVKLFKNVSVQDKSARESLQTFAAGKGDVLIGYENDAIFAKKKGVPLDYTIPISTILIENPIAAVKTSDNLAKAKAFVKFTRSPAAQKIFGNNGYRPVVKSVAKQFHFKKPAKLFTIASLGGWPQVQKRFFDRQNGIMVKVEKEAKGG